MLNKAQKKVIEAEAMEYLFTMSLTQRDCMNEYIESYQARMQELLQDEDTPEDSWRIQDCKDNIEKYKVKAEAYVKISEQLLKLM